MAQLSPARKRRRAGRAVRTVLIAAAVCAALLVSAVAVSPALRGQMAALLGDFSPYVQPVEPSSDTWDGIQLTVVSAMMDDRGLRVYVEAKDLNGDRLSSMPLASEVPYPMYGNVANPITIMDADGGTHAWSVDYGLCLNYNKETNTALLEFTFSWGDFASDSGQSDLVLSIMKLYPEGFYGDAPPIYDPNADGTKNWATWNLSFRVEHMDDRISHLDQTIDEVTQLHTLNISALSAALTYTVPDDDTDTPADSYTLVVYLSDGTTIESQPGTSHGPIEDPETGEQIWFAHWDFSEPVETEEIIGINLAHWYIPLNADGTAGEAYWRFK